jgi:RNA polymerase sigma-70 factor (ECF subfamily)
VGTEPGDTQDLVQDAVLRTLPRLRRSRPAIRAPFKPFSVRPLRTGSSTKSASQSTAWGRPSSRTTNPPRGPSPLEEAIGRERFERYEAALQTLRAADREAIIARIELQQSYEEVAVALGKPTPDAARVAVTRAVARLVQAMAERKH